MNDSVTDEPSVQLRFSPNLQELMLRTRSHWLFLSAYPAISLKPIYLFREILKTGIDVQELLNNYNSTVFKITCPVRGVPTELALKFCFGAEGLEELRQEYDHYHRLELIQYVSIPGEILDKLSIIHEEGFSHLDFTESNVVLRKIDNEEVPKARIIDLRHLEEHTCKVPYGFTVPQEFFRGKLSDICPELIFIAEGMNFWAEGVLWVGGGNVVNKSPDFPDQNTVSDLAPGFGAPSPQQTRCLEKYYKEIKQEIDNGKTVEELRPTVDARFER